MSGKTKKTVRKRRARALRAVPMVRAIRDAMYEETKAMSREEFSAYIGAQAQHVEAATARKARRRRTA